MKKYVMVMVAVVVIAVAVSGAWYLTNSWKSDQGTPESITIGTPANELNALAYIAEDQGYFKANGLDVTFKDFDSGSQAVAGMLNGTVDMAASTEFVIVGQALRNRTVCDIACISKSQNEYLIGRTDRGIIDISSLIGKKIGVLRGTAAEFYLGRLLSLHGIDMEQVNLVDIRASQATDVIDNGSVDAILTWQPYVSQIRELIGDRAIVWPAQSGQVSFWNVMAKDDWTSEHPEEIERFLSALVRAEDYYIVHPDEARDIVQKRLNYSDAYIDAVWPEIQPSLSLDRSLVTAMEDEGRWMITNNLTGEKSIPDFYSYIYMKGLENVKPEAVNIL
jgi:ABC-type nitrate/sulfonate/bicarbonate transport system substrate-binding protein